MKQEVAIEERSSQDPLSEDSADFTHLGSCVEVLASSASTKVRTHRWRLRNVCELLAALALSLTMHPLTAHPGPEPHPTVSEVEDLAAEIMSEIHEVEQRLGERIGDPETLVSELNERVGELGETVSELIQATNELGETDPPSGSVGTWTILGVAGLAGAITGAIAGPIAVRVRPRSKRSPKDLSSAPSQQRTEPADAKESPADDEPVEEEQDEEQDKSRRVVTHTLKEEGTKKILELHNPCEQWWSPRTEQEVIRDIDEEGIPYIARSPAGNESEIEVVTFKRSNRRQLQTKADEHLDNNLRELPDPPKSLTEQQT